MKNEVYFNDLQVAFVQAKQQVRTLIAGRGFGKSTLIALITYEMMRTMPKAKIFYSSTTKEQIMNSTLPPVKEKWAEFGLVEDVHYVVGKKPLSWYKEAIQEPEEYSLVISFFNGFRIQLISTMKPTGKRGGSYQAGIVDEAAFVKKKVFDNVLKPMIRGNWRKFNSQWHLSTIILSSPPRTNDGLWVYGYEKLAEDYPDQYLYINASARANEAVLGDQYFDELRKSMTPQDYDIEVEGKKRDRAAGGFYPQFNERRNCYVAPLNSRRRSSDVNKDQLIEVSFDFSGKFNCATVWQEQDFTERCLMQFHLHGSEGKIPELVKLITKHFDTQEVKFARLWGEPRGRDRNAMSDLDYFEQIAQYFHAEGWATEIMTKPGYKTKGHKQRHLAMNDMLEGKSATLPRILINSATCPDFIEALKQCDIEGDYQKDKSNERDETFPQQWAPHYTDTFDYYLYEKYMVALLSTANDRASFAG